MRFGLFLALVIFLTLNTISQEKVQGYSNIGLVVQNLTRLPTNETCDAAKRNCKYYMDLCFSLAVKRDCSLMKRQSLIWIIKPGGSKILRIGDDVIRYIENPLRFPKVKKWNAQEVVLRVNVRKKDQPNFTEEIQIKERLPYPINKMAKLEEEKFTNCSAHFCLTVALYMWCDNIDPGCVVKIPTTSSIRTTSYAISSNSRTTTLIQPTSSITSANPTQEASIQATSSIRNNNPTMTSLFQATNSITSANPTQEASIQATSSIRNNNPAMTSSIQPTSSIINGDETLSKSTEVADLSTGEIVGIIVGSVCVSVGLVSISIWKHNQKRRSTMTNGTKGKNNKGLSIKDEKYKCEIELS